MLSAFEIWKSVDSFLASHFQDWKNLNIITSPYFTVFDPQIKALPFPGYKDTP